MPKTIVTIDGQRYVVNSEQPLSDDEAYQYALGQHTPAAAGSGPAVKPAARLPPSDGAEPDTFWGGFFRHLIEKEPATVAALGGAGVMAAGVAGAPAAAVTAASAAMPTLANSARRVSRWMRGQPQDELSAGEVAEDLSGPALAFAGPAVGRVARSVASSPMAQKAIGAVTGHATGSVVGHPWIGGALGAKYGAPMVESAAEALAPAADATPGNLASRARASLRSLFGESGDEAASVVEPYMANKSGVRMSREVPGYRMPGEPDPDGWFIPRGEAAAPEPPMLRSSDAESLAALDRYMPNTGAEALDLSERNGASLLRGRVPYPSGDELADARFGGSSMRASRVTPPTRPPVADSMKSYYDLGEIGARVSRAADTPRVSADLMTDFGRMMGDKGAIVNSDAAQIASDVTSALRNLGYKSSDAANIARRVSFQPGVTLDAALRAALSSGAAAR